MFSRFISLSFCFAIIGALNAALAQTGTIRGSVIDDGTGLTIPGVKVQVEGTTKRVLTDLDGEFNIAIDPGSYQVSFTYTAYDTLKLDNIVVDGENVVLLKETRLKPEVTAEM